MTTTPTPASMPRRRPSGPPMVAGYILTKHAMERMLEMELTVDRIEPILTEPEDTWTQDETYGKDRLCFAKGNLGVVTSRRPGETPRIVTVVWRSKKVWERRKRMGHVR